MIYGALHPQDRCPCQVHAQVMSALQQESILADLASCLAPQRKSEQLPADSEGKSGSGGGDGNGDVLGAANNNSSSGDLVPPLLSPRGGLSVGGGSGALNPDAAAMMAAAHAMPSRRLGFASRQTSTKNRVSLADGLTSSIEPLAPGLGLPRLNHTLSTATSIGLQSMSSGLPRRINPELARTLRHRVTHQGASRGTSIDNQQPVRVSEVLGHRATGGQGGTGMGALGSPRTTTSTLPGHGGAAFGSIAPTGGSVAGRAAAALAAAAAAAVAAVDGSGRGKVGNTGAARGGGDGVVDVVDKAAAVVSSQVPPSPPSQHQQMLPQPALQTGAEPHVMIGLSAAQPSAGLDGLLQGWAAHCDTLDLPSPSPPRQGGSGAVGSGPSSTKTAAVSQTSRQHAQLAGSVTGALKGAATSGLSAPLDNDGVGCSPFAQDDQRSAGQVHFDAGDGVAMRGQPLGEGVEGDDEPTKVNATFGRSPRPSAEILRLRKSSGGGGGGVGGVAAPTTGSSAARGLSGSGAIMNGPMALRSRSIPESAVAAGSSYGGVNEDSIRQGSQAPLLDLPVLDSTFPPAASMANGLGNGVAPTPRTGTAFSFGAGAWKRSGTGADGEIGRTTAHVPWAVRSPTNDGVKRIDIPEGPTTPVSENERGSEREGKGGNCARGGDRLASRAAGAVRRCALGLPQWLAAAAVRMATWARHGLARHSRRLRQLRRMLWLQDAGTVHIRRTLVQVWLSFRESRCSARLQPTVDHVCAPLLPKTVAGTVLAIQAGGMQRCLQGVCG